MQYEDAYLLEDVNQVTAYIEQLTQQCVKAIDMSYTADFTQKQTILANISQTLEVLESYHRRKQQRDEFAKINCINRGIRP